MTHLKNRILVIDDQIGKAGSQEMAVFEDAYKDLGSRYEFLFEDCLDNEGRYSCERAVDAVLDAGELDLVLLDIKFGPDHDRLGYEILERLKYQFPSLPVVMMSSLERDVANMQRSLGLGALAFIEKLPDSREFESRIEDAINLARDYAILGSSKEIRKLRREIASLSPNFEVSVVILGERGTGKERVARSIHHNSNRAERPFVGLNCAGLSPELLESELFGHAKGAFTGADTDRKGYFEVASGGTLFLDEIGEMPMRVQVELLRVLQEKRFRRVGVSDREIPLDVQLICATNGEPSELIAEKKLREDFYDRIAMFIIRTPPLRVCREDIPELARYFLQMITRGGGLSKKMDPEASRLLQSYYWPGNRRELRNTVWQAVIKSADSPIIDASCLPEEILKPISQTDPSKIGGPASDSTVSPQASNGEQTTQFVAKLPDTPQERANALSESLLVFICGECLRSDGNAAAVMRSLFPGQNANKRYLGQVAWKIVDWNPRVLSDPSLEARFRDCEPLWSAFVSHMQSSPMTRQKLWEKLERFGVTPPEL